MSRLVALLTLSLALAAPAGASTPAPSAPTQRLNWQIQPGRSLALIALDSSEASLIERFGAFNVQPAQIKLDAGEPYPASVLFPRDANKRIALVWRDSVKRSGVAVAVVRGERSFWTLPGGLGLGLQRVPTLPLTQIARELLALVATQHHPQPCARGRHFSRERIDASDGIQRPTPLERPEPGVLLRNHQLPPLQIKTKRKHIAQHQPHHHGRGRQGQRNPQAAQPQTKTEPGKNHLHPAFALEQDHHGEQQNREKDHGQHQRGIHRRHQREGPQPVPQL